MLLPTTEQLPDGRVLDAMSSRDAVAAMLQSQIAALSVLGAATPDLLLAAEAMAQTLRSGGTLTYAAAGSSGLMALADASELSGTFGISPDQVRVFMAGGVPADGRMSGDVEDDLQQVAQVVAQAGQGDTFIVLSASGTTPYAVAVAKAAKDKGATVIALANNQGSELLGLANIAICLPTPPEALAGSTRLGAATAQKAALNIMSTVMGVKLGHVFGGRMVNVIADNAKLVERAAGIVSDIAQVSRDQAKDALQRTNGNAKAAILVASGQSASAAQQHLSDHHGHLGPCLQLLNRNQNTTA